MQQLPVQSDGEKPTSIKTKRHLTEFKMVHGHKDKLLLSHILKYQYFYNYKCYC